MRPILAGAGAVAMAALVSAWLPARAQGPQAEPARASRAAPDLAFGSGSFVYEWSASGLSSRRVPGAAFIPRMGLGLEGVYVGYDKASGEVRAVPALGPPVTLARPNAFGAWFGFDARGVARFLTQSVERGSRGFRFATGTLSSEAGSWRETAAWELDCFASDILFLDDGILLAGADSADSVHALYHLPYRGGGPRIVAKEPKRGDFARLARVGGGIVLCFSAAKVAPRENPCWFVGSDLVARRSMLPVEAGTCVYGSPFPRPGGLVIPMAALDSSGLRISFAEFGVVGEPRFMRTTAGRGVYAFLGTREADGAVLFVGYDPLDPARAPRAIERLVDGSMRDWPIEP